jgi:hypothetical protein
MNLLLFHAAEGFGEAVDALAEGGTLRDRLNKAARALNGINLHEFDRFPELQTAFEALENSLTAVSDDQFGSYSATIGAMSGPAKARLVKDILALDRMIREQV